MSKKEKELKSIKNNEKLVTEKSVTSILSEDKNNIADATMEAKKTIDSIAYADNLVPPNKKSKSIRSLNLEEKKNENQEQKEKNEKNDKTKTDLDANPVIENTKIKKKKSKTTSSNPTIEKENKKIKEDIKQDTKIEPENKKTKKKKEVIKEEKVNESISTDVTKEIKKDENINKIIPSSEKKSHKTLLILSLSILFIFILFFIFSTIFALIVSTQTTIIHGVKIKDIDVSGLTKEQAFEKVSSTFNAKLEKQINLNYNDYSISMFPEQFNVCFAIEEAVNIAYEKGRNDTNIFQNNYEIVSSMFLGLNINPGFSYSEETLDSLMNEMETNFPDRLIESSYYIENNNLILSKGKDGIVIDRVALKSELIYLINNLHYTIDTIQIPVEQKTASAFDITKIHEEVYRAPQDAYYTTNPYVIHPHVDGVDFAISIEEASNLLNDLHEQYIIPLKVLSPNITTNQIGPEAFPDLLGTYSTTFSTRNVNRSTNIRLASQKINGIVIMPGETFSYNQTVGKRTSAAGFKSAAVYVGGEVTTGIGGGICQVSSTLYNSVLLANLEIVERYNHGFNPGYVPAGRDATVSWGGPDFKFKNNRNYPVKIICTVSGGTILTQVFGLKSDNEYEVEIESYITSYIKYKTVEKNDPTLAKGTTKVLENGSSGCRSVAYRILKQNGEVISKTLLSKDVYNPHNKIVAIGTKQ